MIARYVIFATASVAAHPAAAFWGRSCWLRSTQILLTHLATTWPPLSYRVSSRDGQMLSNDFMRCDPSDSSETTSYQDQRRCARRSELRETHIRAGNRFANIQTTAQSASVSLACCIRLCMARGGSAHVCHTALMALCLLFSFARIACSPSGSSHLCACESIHSGTHGAICGTAMHAAEALLSTSS
jgi:hypothetical protein